MRFHFPPPQRTSTWTEETTNLRPNQPPNPGSARPLGDSTARGIPRTNESTPKKHHKSTAQIDQGTSNQAPNDTDQAFPNKSHMKKER